MKYFVTGSPPACISRNADDNFESLSRAMNILLLANVTWTVFHRLNLHLVHCPILSLLLGRCTKNLDHNNNSGCATAATNCSDCTLAAHGDTCQRYRPRDYDQFRCVIPLNSANAANTVTLTKLGVFRYSAGKYRKAAAPGTKPSNVIKRQVPWISQPDCGRPGPLRQRRH